MKLKIRGTSSDRSTGNWQDEAEERKHTSPPELLSQRLMEKKKGKGKKAAKMICLGAAAALTGAAILVLSPSLRLSLALRFLPPGVCLNWLDSRLAAELEKSLGTLEIPTAVEGEAQLQMGGPLSQRLPALSKTGARFSVHRQDSRFAITGAFLSPGNGGEDILSVNSVWDGRNGWLQLPELSSSWISLDAEKMTQSPGGQGLAALEEMAGTLRLLSKQHFISLAAGLNPFRGRTEREETAFLLPGWNETWAEEAFLFTETVDLSDGSPLPKEVGEMLQAWLGEGSSSLTIRTWVTPQGEFLGREIQGENAIAGIAFHIEYPEERQEDAPSSVQLRFWQRKGGGQAARLFQADGSRQGEKWALQGEWKEEASSLPTLKFESGGMLFPASRKEGVTGPLTLSIGENIRWELELSSREQGGQSVSASLAGTAEVSAAWSWSWEPQEVYLPAGGIDLAERPEEYWNTVDLGGFVDQLFRKPLLTELARELTSLLGGDPEVRREAAVSTVLQPSAVDLSGINLEMGDFAFGLPTTLESVEERFRVPGAHPLEPGERAEYTLEKGRLHLWVANLEAKPLPASRTEIWKFFLTGAGDIGGQDPLTVNEVGIGSGEQAVRKAFGEPSSFSGQGGSYVWKYTDSFHGMELTVCLEDGRVSALAYEVLL